MLGPLAELIRDELDGLTGKQLRYACNGLRRVLDEIDPRPEAHSACKQSAPEPMTEQQCHEFGRTVQLYGRPISQVSVEQIAALVDQHRLQWTRMLEYCQWRNRQQHDGGPA